MHPPTMPVQRAAPMRARAVLLAALASCGLSAVAALPRQLGSGKGAASPVLQQAWDKLDADGQNKATHIYTTAHAILEMGGATPGKKELVVHSLGAAMEREGQYSGDPNAMP
jgi:hypothetical protein